jgi:alkanesulfonate monooxygenase SsuD/methylene tetrahydromethanopterin reductase-like flavin-dependent oxidoreductase (luciferase family)
MAAKDPEEHQMSIPIGIGLPATHKDVPRQQILDWARRADAGPFSSLCVLDRIIYQNLEPMLALAAAAAVTTRVKLLTGILLLPIHNAGIVAKEAATIDSLSGGRMVLGVGVGSRNDDFAITDTPMKGRGKAMEQQLAVLHRVWRGGEAAEGTGPIGPALPIGRPELLIGARSDAALQRVGKWADGYVATPRSPETLAGYLKIVDQSWRENNRQGKPRKVAVVFFALGPDAVEKGQAYTASYYSLRAEPPQVSTDNLPLWARPSGVSDVLSTPEAIHAARQTYEDIGMDELILLPCNPIPEQVDRLADIVG